MRSLAAFDATPEYCSWLNDPEVYKYLEVRGVTLEDVRAYIAKRNVDPNALLLGIFDKDNDRHMGNIKLEPIDWDKKTAVFGIVVGDKNYWRKGYGTEATRLIIDYAFQKLGLKEIILGFVSEHEAARKSYERAGFSYVRTDKKALCYDGISYDEIIMSIKKDHNS